MSEDLNIKKRVNSIKIEDMQPKEGIIDGQRVKFCLNCGINIPKSNLKYCSLKCSNEFYAKHNQQGLRKYVFKREHGKCQMCGYKSPTPPKAPLKPKKPGWVEGGYKAYQKALVFYEQSIQEYKEVYANWHETVYKEWKKNIQPREFVADHIIPIALGGDEFDLKNIQLLCEVCNKKKTAKDQQAIGKKRKLIKRVGKNVKPLTQYIDNLKSIKETKK